MNLFDSILSVTFVLSVVGLMLALSKVVGFTSTSGICRVGLVSVLLTPVIGLVCHHLALPTWQVIGPDRVLAPNRSSGGIPWGMILTLGWLLGSGFHLVRIVSGVIAVRRLRSRSMFPDKELQYRLDSILPDRWRGQLRVNALVGTPCVIGWCRPLLLLPTECLDWREEHLRHAILHEVAHLECGDVWWRLIEQCVLAVWWWHPGARYLVKQAHEASEFACDQAVLRTGADPVEYVRGLLSLIGCGSLPSSVPAFAARSESALTRRVRHMLSSRPNADGSGWPLILAVLVIGGVTAAAATIRLSNGLPLQNPESPLRAAREAILRLDANPFPGGPDAGP